MERVRCRLENGAATTTTTTGGTQRRRRRQRAKRRNAGRFLLVWDRPHVSLSTQNKHDQSQLVPLLNSPFYSNHVLLIIVSRPVRSPSSPRRQRRRRPPRVLLISHQICSDCRESISFLTQTLPMPPVNPHIPSSLPYPDSHIIAPPLLTSPEFPSWSQLYQRSCSHRTASDFPVTSNT